MTRTLIADIGTAHRTDTALSVTGWIRRVRNLGGVIFLMLEDRTGTLQLVADNSIPHASTITAGTIIRAVGPIVHNTKAQNGIELHIKEYEVLATADPDIPLPINQSLDNVSLDAILDNRMISLRNRKIRHIFTLQSAILRYFSEYLRSQGFTEIKTSKLIRTGTEGGTELFPVSYFDETVYLAQSPQFYKQAMVASGLERVFEIGAAYRAEKHETARHLNEYISLDIEMAFIEDEHDLIDVENNILHAIFEGVMRDCADIIEEWGSEPCDPSKIEAIPRITYDEARQIARQKMNQRIFELTPEAERHLCEWARAEHGIDALYITRFPRRKRPFYTYPADDQTMSFDLLYRGQEITTGGRRIHNYNMLSDSIEQYGLDANDLKDYIPIFQYGCPPHGGFAIGLERLTQQILGIGNVKHASLFPRDRHRTRP